MPAAALLAHQPVLLQRRQHAIEVVLLNVHRLGDFRNGDAGPGADELERLLGARAAAARTSATPGAAAGGGAVAPFARGRGGRGAAAGGQAVEGGRRGLEAVELLDERAELLQARVD